MALSELDHACDVLRPELDSEAVASTAVFPDEARAKGDNVTTPPDAGDRLSTRLSRT
ncbi:hypothetical protein [Natrialba magadii]|uniref:hypothetical protein n=1 Tax=Natrialba magadii TaxID=13769 RepID=UPI0001959D2C|nr:hypothetical protein [Natrialba magadii]